jgi:hypothetical protein
MTRIYFRKAEAAPNALVAVWHKIERMGFGRFDAVKTA